MTVQRVEKGYEAGPDQVKVFAAMTHLDAVRIDVVPVDDDGQPCTLDPGKRDSIADKAWVCFRGATIHEPGNEHTANLWFEVNDSGMVYIYDKLTIEQLEATLKFCNEDAIKHAN